MQAETAPGSEFLSLFRISEFFPVYIADFLSQFGKWARLIIFEAEYEHFYAWKVEKRQNNTSPPSFYNVYVTN